MGTGVLEVEHVVVFDFMSCCVVENEVPNDGDICVVLGFVWCMVDPLWLVLVSMVFLLVYVLLMNKIMFVSLQLIYFVVMGLILYDRENVKNIGGADGFLFVFNSFMMNIGTGALVC